MFRDFSHQPSVVEMGSGELAFQQPKAVNPSVHYEAKRRNLTGQIGCAILARTNLQRIAHEL
jgi:hypothetical protein